LWVLRKQNNFYMLILCWKDPVIFIGGVAILLEGLGLPIYINLHTFWIFFEWRKRSCENFNSLHYDGLKPAARGQWKSVFVCTGDVIELLDYFLTFSTMELLLFSNTVCLLSICASNSSTCYWMAGVKHKLAGCNLLVGVLAFCMQIPFPW